MTHGSVKADQETGIGWAGEPLNPCFFELPEGSKEKTKPKPLPTLIELLEILVAW